MKPFRDLRIIELAGSEAGAYAGKLFADHGATVIKVEPPGGDPLRDAGVSWLTDGSRVGSTWAYLNTSKHSAVVEDGDAAGLEALLAGADAVIESSSPDPLTARTDGLGGDGLVRARVSPFGGSGPYAPFRSNWFTDEAIGGQLYPNGEPDREPIRRPGLHVAYQAGTHAFIGTMAALRVRDRSGRGQTVEIAHFEGAATLHQHTTTMWTHGGHILRREGNRQPGQWHPVGCYPCQDGYVHLSLASGAKLLDFLAVAGLTEITEDPRFNEDYARGSHKDEFDAAFEPWLREHTAAEIIAIGHEVFAPVGPVPGMLELLEDPQLLARDYWRELPGTPPLKLPRGPFHLGGVEPRPLPPPALGRSTASEPAAMPAPGDDRLPEHGPLEGIRVLDLTRVWAGALGRPHARRSRRRCDLDRSALEPRPSGGPAGGGAGQSPLPGGRDRRAAVEPRRRLQQAASQPSLGHVELPGPARTGTVCPPRRRGGPRARELQPARDAWPRL